jgi:formylglycine-generating enzyme required for sulfatase activity
MFFKVGSEVEAATSGRQRPEISISMYEQYTLVPGAAKPAETGPAGGSASATEAAQAWEAVKTSPSVEVIDEFLRQYGNVPVYGVLARTRREELVKQTPAQPQPQVAMADRPERRDGVPLTAAQERALKPKDTFKECTDCPEMMVVPAGSFTMGSAANEKGRFSNEGPQHVVTIGKPFAVGKTHVTVDQFAAFVRETRYRASSNCYKWVSAATSNGSWRNPGFTQEGSHPVVCITWEDAKAYADWVAKKTGEPYRMLSEAEFEYAARGRTSAGTYPRFWFGDDERDLCRHANVLDQKARASIPLAGDWTEAPCNDGYAYTSPAGHYAPNAFGLYDMAGNAASWTADWYHDSYDGAPSDGSAWTTPSSNVRVTRGGSHDSAFPRTADRGWNSDPGNLIGFRLARTLRSAGSSGN